MLEGIDVLEVLEGGTRGNEALEHFDPVDPFDPLKQHTPFESRRVPVLRSQAMLTKAAD